MNKSIEVNDYERFGIHDSDQDRRSHQPGKAEQTRQKSSEEQF